LRDAPQSFDAPAEYTRHAHAQAERLLAEAEQQAKLVGVPCEVVKVEHGQPYEAIIETAGARGCDLITMASHGRRGISALLLGSETMKVLMHSKLPVLIYR
jgi:nucleotide-binding universal stress UspA family protein